MFKGFGWLKITTRHSLLFYEKNNKGRGVATDQKFTRGLCLSLCLIFFLAAKGNNKLDNIGIGNYSASAIYSLRKVSSEYTGPVIQVRRGSDNMLQDIGFNSNNDLDVNSLVAFIGNSDGYIVRWFDQSGNSRDASQTLVNLQPRIALAGQVYLNNGIPAIFFSGNERLVMSSFSATSINAVTRPHLNGGGTLFRGIAASATTMMLSNTGSGNWGTFASVEMRSNTQLLANKDYILTLNGTDQTFYTNGASSNTYLNTEGQGGHIGGTPIGNQEYTGFISEVSMFNTAISASDQKKLEANQATYYKVAFLTSQPTLSLCNNSLMTYTATSGVAGTNFSWRREVVSGISNTAATGVGANINEHLINTTLDPIVVQYIFNLTAPTSTSSNQIVSVTVYPTLRVETQPEVSKIVCNNRVSNLFTAGGGGSSTYQYQWFSNTINSASGWTVVQDAINGSISIPATNQTTTQYFYVLVKDAVCNTTIASEISEIVSVALPVGKITGDVLKCVNSGNAAITFSATGGTAPYTFEYVVNQGITQYITTATGSSITLNVPTDVDGVFTYKLLNTRESGVTGCSNNEMSSSQLEIRPLPNGRIQGNAIVCQNQAAPQVTFSTTSNPGAYLFNYRINTGEIQTISSGVNDNVSVSVPTTNPGLFTIQLISVTEAQTGCSRNINESVSVSVKALPQASISGDTKICQNTTPPKISFSAAEGTQPYIFTYRINNSNNTDLISGTNGLAELSVPTHTSGILRYTLISVKESSAEGCVADINKTVAVTISALPSATISGNAVVCLNTSPPEVRFAGLSTEESYVFTYKINNGEHLSVSSVGGNSTSIKVPTERAGEFSYSLIGVQQVGGQQCSSIIDQSVLVKVKDLPTAEISESVTVCQNQTAPLVRFTGKNGTGPFLFTYSINNEEQQYISSGFDNIATINVSTNNSKMALYNLIGVKDQGLNGCQNVINISAAVVVKPLPSANISPDTVICQNTEGQKLVIKGAEGTLPYVYSYQINNGTIQSLRASGNNIAEINIETTNPGIYSFKLLNITETGINACSVNTDMVSHVVINPSPQAKISGNAIVCQNSPSPQIIFSGSATNAEEFLFTYRINNESEKVIKSNSSNNIVLDVSTKKAGTFVYTLTKVEEARTGGCSTKLYENVKVIVNPLPSATISRDIAVCQNSASPNVTFSGLGSSPPYIFTYSINNGSPQTIVSTEANVSLKVPTSEQGTLVYRLLSIEEQRQNACINLLTETYSVVTIRPSSTAAIYGTKEICQNEPAPMITFEAQNGTPPFVFTYKINGGPDKQITAEGASASLYAPTSVSGSFTYSLISVKDSLANLCINPIHGVVAIKVNAEPSAPVIKSSKQILCKDSATLEVQNFIPGHRYLWMKNDDAFFGTEMSSFQQSAEGVFSAYAISDKGCMSGNSSNTIKLIESQGVQIKGVSQICEGGTTRLVMSARGDLFQYETFKWIDKQGKIKGQDSSHLAREGVYLAIGSKEKCFDTTEIAITSDEVYTPVGEIKVSPDVVKYGEQTNISADVPGAVRYIWDINGSGNIGTQNSKLIHFFYTKNDSIQIGLTAINERNCKAVFIKKVAMAKKDIPFVSQPSVGNIKDWNVFPSPFRSMLNMSVILQKGEMVKVDLFSENGQWLKSWTLNGIAGENLFELKDIEKLPSKTSFYIVAWYNGKKHMDKIIKL